MARKPMEVVIALVSSKGDIRCYRVVDRDGAGNDLVTKFIKEYARLDLGLIRPSFKETEEKLLEVFTSAAVIRPRFVFHTTA